MGKLFLGKWWHWLLIAVPVYLLWWAGQRKLHVIEFNTFVMVLLVSTVVVVWVLVKTTRDGEQITRDELHEPSD